MRLNLSRKVWYVHLFFWCLGIWEAFRDYDHRYDASTVEKMGTNLCFFIRVMAVYMPLVFLLHVAFLAVAIASLTALPIALFGGAIYAWSLVALAAIFAISWVTKKALRYIEQRQSTTAEAASYEEKLAQQQQVVEAAERGPGFFEVLWAYIVSAKKKVCPSITFFGAEEA